MILRKWQGLILKHPLIYILELFLASRLTLVLVGWVANLRVPGGHPPQPFGLTDAPLIWDMWIRWDSQWFLEIARLGGYWTRQGLPLPQAFFPLYPLLMRFLSPLFGGRTYLAGLAISNLALLAGCVILHQLLAQRWSSRIAARAVAYVILFPTGFFLSALYTEGLFFFAAVAAFYAAARRRWFLAGLMATAAALTRNLGVFLAPALALEYLSQRGFRWRQVSRDILWLGLVPLGLGLYMYYLYATVGDPLAFLHAEQRWGRHLAYPWQSLALAASYVLQPAPPQPAFPQGVFVSAWRHAYRRLYSALDLTASLTFLALAFYAWRRKVPPGQILFLLAGVVIPLSAPALRSMTPIPSMTRYVAVLFPGFTSLAFLGENPTADRALWVAFPMLQGLFFLLFTTWNWIA